jgi:DNA-binding IclR family transcriptional regulator
MRVGSGTVSATAEDPMTPPMPRSRYFVPMVGHAFAVLELFFDGESELGLQQVTTLAQVTKSSAFRILLTLESLGYLEKNAESGKFRLGGKLFEAAGKARGRRSVVQVARPYMRSLHDEFGESVNLGGLQGLSVVYIDALEGSYAFRLAVNVGAQAPLHASALGKAILALQPPDRRAALFGAVRFDKLTPRTITSRDKLERALEAVKQKGYAMDAEEVELGASCVAAPIVDREGVASHAISVSGPNHRMKERLPAIVSAVTRAAASIRQGLYPGDG